MSKTQSSGRKTVHAASSFEEKNVYIQPMDSTVKCQKSQSRDFSSHSNESSSESRESTSTKTCDANVQSDSKRVKTFISDIELM